MRLGLAIVAGALVLGSPARAEDQEPILRCLTVTTAVAGSQDKAMAQIGFMNSVYWLGRLDPAVSEADIEKRMSALARGMTQPILQAELKRCGDELVARGAMMQRVGKKIEENAARPDAKQPGAH